MPVTLQQPECDIIQARGKRLRHITAIYVGTPILEVQHTFLRHTLPHDWDLVSQKDIAFVSAPFGHIIISFVPI
jgi:hypothetical protein